MPSALDRSEEFLNRPSSSYLCYNLIEPLARERERTENEKYVNYIRFYTFTAFNFLNRPQALREKFQFLLRETHVRFPEQKIIGCVKRILVKL